ncbi:MAG: ParB/RepB/Spo0J family partition protein [Candidatus Saccharimonadales bacterium]
MAMKKGLGRGFSSLIPDDLLDESFDPSAGDDHKVSDLRNIKLSDISPDPDQPRRHFDETGLAELSASIAEHGVLQPIVVVPLKEGKYQIVAGERRYRASVAAGKGSIPALVRTLSAQHKLELSLIENIQRRDLNPLETATAYVKLRDQFNLTLEEIGTRVGGKSVSAISNTLRLLKLPADAKQAVAEGKLTEGQARPLIGIEESLVNQVLPKIINEHWSARRVEEYVATARPVKATEGKVQKPRRLVELPVLMKRFGTRVTTQQNNRGVGKIVIEFTSEEERQRIEAQLGQ